MSHFRGDIMKYNLKKDEERARCVMCNKSFAKKKGSKIKTCSKKCAHRLGAITKRKNKEK